MLAAAGLDSADAYANTAPDWKAQCPIDPVVPGNMAPQTISAQSTFTVTDTLTTAIWGGNGWRGTGWRAARDLKRHDISGKTGTTNESRDAWFSGYTPNLVATSGSVLTTTSVVWAGPNLAAVPHSPSGSTS